MSVFEEADMAMYERKHVLRESFFPAENMPLIRMRKAQFVLRKVFDHDEEEKNAETKHTHRDGSFYSASVHRFERRALPGLQTQTLGELIYEAEMG